MFRHKISLTEYDEFHEHNLFLPTRTIYFGGKELIEEDNIVTSKTIANVVKNLHILEHREIAPISILLNTPGGNWDDGILVYDLIRSLKSSITIIGLGQVCSMGSIILQSAKKRILTENTVLMIHDGSNGFYGDTKSFERWAERAKKIRQIMYQIYYEKMIKKNPKITLKQVEELCNHDTIYTAQEAVNIGLADSIIEKI